MGVIQIYLTTPGTNQYQYLYGILAGISGERPGVSAATRILYEKLEQLSGDENRGTLDRILADCSSRPIAPADIDSKVEAIIRNDILAEGRSAGDSSKDDYVLKARWTLLGLTILGSMRCSDPVNKNEYKTNKCPFPRWHLSIVIPSNCGQPAFRRGAGLKYALEPGEIAHFRAMFRRFRPVARRRPSATAACVALPLGSMHSCCVLAVAAAGLTRVVARLSGKQAGLGWRPRRW